MIVPNFSELSFWRGWFASNFPTVLWEDEEEELSLSEWMEVHQLLKEEDILWWEDWTNFSPEVLEEQDGYVDHPKELIYPLEEGRLLHIDCHPGDIIYTIGEKEIGSTGPHYKIHVLSWDDVASWCQGEGEQWNWTLFFLLLPMVHLQTIHQKECVEKMTCGLQKIVPLELCEPMARLLADALMGEE